MNIRNCTWWIGGLVAFVLACGATVNTQTAVPGNAATDQGPAQKPLLSDAVFKNVQLLKGIPVGEFMDAINKANFGGQKVLTCYSCHRGDLRPEAVPSLLVQYSLPVEDPNRVEIVRDAPPGPSANAILDKYIDAIGGAQRVASLRSFTGRGTYQAFDTYDQKVPFEIFAAAPNKRTTIVHTQNGDSVSTFDGQSGWTAGVDKPVTLLPLIAGGELDGAKFDAELALPVRIKQSLNAQAIVKIGCQRNLVDN